MRRKLGVEGLGSSCRVTTVVSVFIHLALLSTYQIEKELHLRLSNNKYSRTGIVRKYDLKPCAAAKRP